MLIDREDGRVVVYSGHRDKEGNLLAEPETVLDRLREALPEGQRRLLPRMHVVVTTPPWGPVRFVTTVPGEEGRRFVDAIAPYLDPDSPTSVWH